MPKSKPTQVIVHRIELQEKEREMMETLIVGKTARNIVEPAIAVGGLYVAYKTAYALHGWGEDIVTKFTDRVREGILTDPDLSGATIDPLSGTTTDSQGNTTTNYPLPYYWLKALFS